MSRPARCWYRAVTPLSLNVAALVPKTGMSSGLAPNASRLRISCRATSRSGVRAAAPLELVDRHHVGEVEHVDLLQLRGGAELRRHHVQRHVRQPGHPGVALADARRLQDHQVIAGRRARGDDVLDAVRQLAAAPRGQAAEEHVVAVEGVHPDPVAEQGAAAAPPGRVDREHRDPQLVLLVGAEPADQLVGERRLAGAAGARDAKHRDPAGPGCHGQCRAVRRGQPARLQAGDGPGERGALARQHRFGAGGPPGEIGVAGPDQLVDHPRQAEPLAVLRGEDPHARRGQPGDLLGDDHSAAAAENLHVPGAWPCAATAQILEVLDVAALVGADRDALRVLVEHRVDHLADRAVVAQVHHLGPLGLQDAPHDVDRRVMPVEQRGRRHEAHRVGGHVQVPRELPADRDFLDVQYLEVKANLERGSSRPAARRPAGYSCTRWSHTVSPMAAVSPLTRSPRRTGSGVPAGPSMPITWPPSPR